MGKWYSTPGTSWSIAGACCSPRRASVSATTITAPTSIIPTSSSTWQSYALEVHTRHGSGRNQVRGWYNSPCFITRGLDIVVSYLDFILTYCNHVPDIQTADLLEVNHSTKVNNRLSQHKLPPVVICGSFSLCLHLFLSTTLEGLTRTAVEDLAE
jgi:hypothetical protein